MLRGDTAKDTLYSQKRSSSASQMAAATVMDVVARLPRFVQDKQPTQYQLALKVRMEDPQKNGSKIPKSECPDTRIRLPRHRWPKLMDKH